MTAAVKPVKVKADRLRLAFAPYDPEEVRDELKSSAVAFAELRNALKVSQAKPNAPEEPDSWEAIAGLHLFFSRGEVRRVEQMGVSMQTGNPVSAPVIVLDPAGYTNVLPTPTVAILRSIWREYMKTNGMNANALRIKLTNDWLCECVTDATDESALASGAITLIGAGTQSAEDKAPTPAAELAPVGE